MSIMTRRSLLATAPIAAAVSAPKPEFPVTREFTCLNNARWHPMSKGTRRAMEQFLDFKSTGGLDGKEIGPPIQSEARQRFAQLINATPSEISLVQSTTMGENLVVRGLGIPQSGGNIVTDALHFQGSLFMYLELAKQGLEVRIVQPHKDWRVHLEDLDKQIDRNTRLVALSQVSMITGHEHNLKAVSDLAHSKGTLVYADIIQAAGAMPIDVQASGVDFAACSSFKWLMADFGLGFLYTNKRHLGGKLQRSIYGYRQTTATYYHLLPHESAGERFVEFETSPEAFSYFEASSTASIVAAAVKHSLGEILNLGVANIQAHRQPLLDRLRKEMPRLGFEPLTPIGSNGPLLVFAKKDAAATHGAELKAAKVDVSVYPHRIRIAPSIYNDQSDIDRLLNALS